MTEGTAPAATSALRLANFNTFNPKTSLHFAETYVFRPTQLARFGELFVVLQIDHATKTSPQVGDAIATILNHEYFRGNPSNVVQNLEDALHKTNEILSDLAARGEIHWIGKLHGVIGVFQKDAIHLSASGRGKAFLVRDGEIAEVTAGLYDGSRAASPMKTFENLASGELREGDTIIMTTPGVTDYLTPDSLRNLLESNEPAEAVKAIQSRVGHDASSANASVVFTYSHHHSQAPATASVSTMPIPSSSPTKSATAAVLPTSAPSASPLAPVEPKDSPAASKASARSRAAGMFAGAFGKVKNILPKRGAKKPTEAVHPASQTPAAAEKTKSKGSFGPRLKKAIIRMPAKVKVFGGLALVLVVVFVVSLVVFSGVRGARADRAEITAKFDQAKKLEEDAAAAIIFQDKTQAQELLKQSEALLAELPQSDAVPAGELDTLKNNIAADYEKISGSTRIQDPNKLASLSGNPIGLVLLDGQLVSWSTSGKLEVVSLKDGDTATGATIESDLGEPILGAVDETQLVLVTDEDNVIGFEDGQLDELTTGTEINAKNLVATETYGNRLYVLDPKANEIMRYQRTIAGYGQGSSWVLDGTSVENGVDIAIDGNVWLLQKDGTVVKFLQGSKEEFTLGPVVDPLESPTRLVTSEDSNYLFVLEPKKHRLLQFDKEKGDFVKQFVSDAFTDLRDMVIIDKGAKAYVLNGDSIFQIELNK